MDACGLAFAGGMRQRAFAPSLFRLEGLNFWDKIGVIIDVVISIDDKGITLRRRRPRMEGGRQQS